MRRRLIQRRCTTCTTCCVVPSPLLLVAQQHAVYETCSPPPVRDIGSESGPWKLLGRTLSSCSLAGRDAMASVRLSLLPCLRSTLLPVRGTEASINSLVRGIALIGRLTNDMLPDDGRSVIRIRAVHTND